MGKLYLEGVVEADGRLGVSTETATCLALVSYLSSPVEVFLLPTDSLPSVLFKLPPGMTVTHISTPPPPASLCAPPVVSLDDGISCASGLSTVLRQVTASNRHVNAIT